MGEKALQLTRRLLANGDEHRNEEKATITVCTALLGWPDHAVLAAVRSGVGEGQGEVNGIERRMVAKFGTLGQTGEASTREQSAQRHSGRVDTQA